MKKLLVAAAIAAVSSTAAADSFIYAGANVGQAGYDSENSTVFGAHVGTGILPIIGLEAGYQKLVDAKIGGADTDVSTFYFAAKPSVDIGPLHVYAKAGLHSWSGDEGATEDDGVDMMYGVGVEYFLIDSLSVGASWMQYKLGGDTIDGESNQLAATATFHFL